MDAAKRTMTATVPALPEQGSGDGLEDDAEPLLPSYQGGPGAAAGARLSRVVSESTLLASEDGDSWKVYRHEVVRLLSLAAPLAASQFCSFALSLISLAFIGRLGRLQLSAAVLATTFFNVTGLSVQVGFSGALETLCGQAYGAENFPAVGRALQRAVCLSAAVSAGLVALWTQAVPLMLAAGQEAAIVGAAARYLLLSVPALFCLGLFECLRRYLMAQGVVNPPTAITAVAVAAAPPLNWLLIFKLGWGLDGAVVATDTLQVLMLVALVAWTARRDRGLRGTRHQTWHGWSREALTGWGAYLSLALPSTAMVCMEWWVFEACILMAGALPEPELRVAVMGLALNTSALLYMLPMGIGAATSVRVSNALGAGLPNAARRSATVATATTLCSQLVLAGALLACRGAWPYVFTREAEVAAATSRVLPYMALALAGDGVNAVLSGMLRGAGRQGLGALLNLSSYWGVGLPAAAALAFGAGWGVEGLWTGLACGTTVQGVTMIVVALRFIDWDREARRAVALAHAASADSELCLTVLSGSSSTGPG